MPSILDPKFRYVASKHMGHDYLRKRFARIRRQMEQQKAKPQNVQPMKARKAA